MAVLSAGLPNITGEARRATSDLWTSSGAFTNNGKAGNGFSGGTAFQWTTMGFDASKSNSIYGSSTTVQPPALQFIPNLKL